MSVHDTAVAARQAALRMAAQPDEVRRRALLLAAQALEGRQADILAANARDIAQADAENLAAPLRKRLRFDEAKLAEACEGLRALAALANPLGRTQLATELAEGLSLYRVSCPIGVIGVVFESRPDALVQIAGLCIRSGNAALLKCGREARLTCGVLFEAMDAAAREAGLPEGWAALLYEREDVAAMLSEDASIDLIIPRGSNAFVRHIMQNTKIPVLGHADGICHVYVDRAADIPMAVTIAVDSKAQYVAVCNAAETLLVHADIAAEALPALAEGLRAAGVEIRGCPRTRAFIDCEPATEADWREEYLDYRIAIRVVDSLDEAIDHINTYGSGHTDAIVTADEAAARAFLARVDSAGVYHNCSTRFADGFRYGFGAEVGVATGKIHARGPMGIEGLCTYKYKLLGNGHTVGGGVAYTHKPLDSACPADGESPA